MAQTLHHPTITEHKPFRACCYSLPHHALSLQRAREPANIPAHLLVMHKNIMHIDRRRVTSTHIHLLKQLLELLMASPTGIVFTISITQLNSCKLVTLCHELRVAILTVEVLIKGVDQAQCIKGRVPAKNAN